MRYIPLVAAFCALLAALTLIATSVVYSLGTALTASAFKPNWPNDPALLRSLTLAAAGASGLAIILIGYAVTRLNPRGIRSGPNVLLAILVACFFLGVVLAPEVWATQAVKAAPDYSRQKQVVVDATPGCAGQAISGTHAYAGQRHPIVVIDTWVQAVERGEQNDVSSHALDSGLLPDTLDSVQLVACIGPLGSDFVETCVGSIESRRVSIYRADTGKLVGDETFAGSASDPCSGDQVPWYDSRIWDYIATWARGQPS